MILIPMVVISLTWFLTISYFRSLEKSKFKVIEEIEKR